MTKKMNEANTSEIEVTVLLEKTQFKIYGV